LKLLLDHNLPPRLARALNELFPNHTVVALRERFRPDVPDAEWIAALDAEGGWAALTRDLRIRTRPHERAAMDRARVVFFFLAGQWTRFPVEKRPRGSSAHAEDGGADGLIPAQRIGDSVCVAGAGVIQ
jgi:hypothetical protein